MVVVSGVPPMPKFARLCAGSGCPSHGRVRSCGGRARGGGREPRA